MPSEFVKKLEDVIRQELLVMGVEYGSVIETVEDSPGSGGAVVRMHPPYDDVTFETPDPDLASDVFAARVARRLRVSIEAPERPPAAEE